jgi:hypothetical protein
MTWWGGGWGNHVPQSAKEVAKAFFAGKSLRRSSCRTNGESYWFINSDGREVEIARRLKDDKAIAEAVVEALSGVETWRPLEFNTRGWRTPTTARHFNALGLKVQCIGRKNVKFWVNGRLMPDSWMGFFSFDDISAWPDKDPDEVAREERRARVWARKERRFVQLTPSLFEWDDYERLAKS